MRVPRALPQGGPSVCRSASATPVRAVWPHSRVARAGRVHAGRLLLCLAVASRGSQLLPPPPASSMASVSPAALGASHVNKSRPSANVALSEKL